MILSRLAYLLRSRLYPPDVIVDFIYEDGLLFVAVKNIGDGPAQHVSVAFQPGLRGVHGTVEIADLALFRNLTFLAPHKEIRAFLDVGHAYFQREAPTRITASIDFQSEHGVEFHRSITHDLSIYRELGDLHTSQASAVAHASASPPPRTS